MNSLSQNKFNIDKIRDDFPILNTKVNGKPLIYLDNAATMQMPLPVLKSIQKHYENDNANVHRGIHTLSEKSSYEFEQARACVKDFIGACSSEEIVFCSGTTDAINIVASMLEISYLSKGDEIIVSNLEHHSNFVPWQMLCKKVGARLRIIANKNGDLDKDDIKQAINKHTKLIAITQVSNVTGTITPAKEIIDIAHQHNIPVLVDGAQGIRHCLTSMQDLACDFYCFSGHKLGALSGIGVLYISSDAKMRCSLKDNKATLPPVRFGGSMVDTVSSTDTTFAPSPLCYEAGTPNYVGAISLAATLNYISALGREKLAAYETSLLNKLEQSLQNIDGVRILGLPNMRAACISFVAEGAHPLDLATLLDKMGVAVRSGQLCAQPVLESFGVTRALRVSPAFYNTEEEIDLFINYLKQTLKLLRRYRE